ncbi:hypothetical protein BH23BAC1_BH23BAC1_35970 [soil metagenome]
MRVILILISIAGLALTVVPSLLVFTGIIELASHKNLMMIGTVMWFFTAPFWMNKKMPEAN